MSPAMIRLALPLLLLVGACAGEIDGDDTRWEATSIDGLYEVVVATDAPPVTGTNVFHVDVADADGAPVSDAAVEVEATMPAHGHGLDPVDAEAMGGGRYDVTLALPMGGAWRLHVGVDGAGGVDAAVVDVEVR